MSWPSNAARTKNWGTEILTDSDLESQFDLLCQYFIDSLNASTGHGHTGTTNDGPKLNLASALTIASQAQGDIIYASSASSWARLGAGTSGQYLKTQGTGANPTWATIISNIVFRATQSAATTMTGSLVKVGFGTSTFDTASAYSTVNSRYTPTTSGYYNISAQVSFTLMTADVDCQIAIYKNGSIYSSFKIAQGAGSSAHPITLNINDIISMNGTTDYVEIYAKGENTRDTSADSSTFFLGNLIF